jgi:subfamily B ATP-binding cassette protein MsbA
MSDEYDEELKAGNISNIDKLQSLYNVATHEPKLTVSILVFGLTTAILEGIGLGFILPIIQQTRSDGDPSGLAAIFAGVYDALGIPFSLEFIILGVASVLAVRYAASFGVQWLRGVLRARYVRYLRDEAFQNGLNAKISYFDQQGSDDILNTIISRSE